MVTRDATKLAVGGVIYTPWCDEHGKVVDDGTVHRLDDDALPLDRGRPAAPLAAPEQRRARRDRSTEETEATAALALQGPLSRDVLEAATGESFADLRYFRRRASKIGKVAIDVSRTGYTGDLGYELWIPATQRGQGLGRADRRRARLRHPAGRHAGARCRPARGRASILIEVDYTSARHAMNPEQNYSPGEIGLGRLVSFDKGDFVGRLALEREAKAGGPARRLVGLQLDWYDIEGLYDAQGLPPAISPIVDRSPVPVFAAGRQVGRATSLGWSPILKQAIALASVAPRTRRSAPGSGSSGPSRAAGAGSTRPSSSCRSSTWSASAPD